MFFPNPFSLWASPPRTPRPTTLAKARFIAPMPTADIEKKRDALRYKVCRDYPWLAFELFDLEGALGWGPGHREYDGDGFPPPLPDAQNRLRAFETIFEQVPPDNVFPDLIQEADGIKKASKPASLVFRHLSLRRRANQTNEQTQQQMDNVQRKFLICMRYALKMHKTRHEGEAITRLYGLIADRYSPYVLGGARMFFYQWRDYQRYALAAAGLAWLFVNPLTPLNVKVETALRRFAARAEKLRLTLPASSALQKAKVSAPETPPAFIEAPQHVVVYETSRV